MHCFWRGGRFALRWILFVLLCLALTLILLQEHRAPTKSCMPCKWMVYILPSTNRRYAFQQSRLGVVLPHLLGETFRTTFRGVLLIFPPPWGTLANIRQNMINLSQHQSALSKSSQFWSILFKLSYFKDKKRISWPLVSKTSPNFMMWMAEHINMLSRRHQYYLEYQSAFKIRELRRCHCDEGFFPLKWLVAQKEILAKGILGRTWFLFRVEKSPGNALIVQINSLSSVRTTTGQRPWDLDNEGNSRALSHPQRENQVPPQIPLARIPSAPPMMKGSLESQNFSRITRF